MLVLSRKGNEQIFIDDQICIKVLSIRGKSVRLGIEAPNEVTVVRGEVVAKLTEQAVPREKTSRIQSRSRSSSNLARDLSTTSSGNNRPAAQP